MDLEYHPLLQIRLQHDYFTDGNCPTLEIVPSPATARLLQTMTVRIVQRKFGVELFYGVRNGQPTPLAELTESLRLSFWLRATTPLFHNYTAHLFGDGSASLFYATNLDQGAAKSVTFPHNPEAMVPLKAAQFQLDISSDSEDVDVTDENDDVQDEASISVHEVDESTKEVTVNTGNLQAGRYYFNNGDEETAFLAGADGHKPGDIGLLSLYLGDIGEGGRAVINADGTIEEASFTIAFEARSTIWRYNLIASSGEFRDFSIRSEGEGPEFIIPTQATRSLPNNTEAALLVSASPIPLRTNPSQRFLLSFTDDGGRVHSDALTLPNAGAESLSRDGPDSTQLISDMYVYI